MILMMKIAMMENFKWWKSAGLDVDYLMMRNSMLWSFKVSAKIMKESMITVIIHAKYLQFKRQDKYEIPVVFRNVWNYDNHFIIKQLVEEFEEKFECLGENLKSYVTFSALIETQKNAKIVKHKIRFIELVVFMNNSLSSLIDSLAEGQCKDFKSSLEYVTAENGLLTFKCVDCNTTYEENLSESFENTDQFCDGDINNICLTFQKCVVYPWITEKESLKIHY